MATSLVNLFPGLPKNIGYQNRAFVNDRVCFDNWLSQSSDLTQLQSNPTHSIMRTQSFLKQILWYNTKLYIQATLHDNQNNFIN